MNPVWIIFLVSMLSPVPVTATETHVGKVVRIADGDTLTLFTDGRQIKIRLAEIDTPEKGQPFGNQSKKALAGLVFSKQVKVTVVEVDRYGRTVGQIVTVGDNLDVNAALVSDGFAWVYRRYAKRLMLVELEEKARKEGRGLWAAAHPIAPWEWRRGERENRLKTVTSAAFACGVKKYCGEMTSCEEACFYLEQCGLTRLDEDNDGGVRRFVDDHGQ